MLDISSDELLEGLLGYGLFADKLPDVFTSEPFYQYYKSKGKPKFDKKGHDYVRYESIRDTNIPRPLGIPNPFAYANLCNEMSNNWDRLQSFFDVETNTHTYKLSRIHIRKMVSGKHLFEMNYKHFEKDGTPEQKIIIPAKFHVAADISNCFPSMYSHSIPWALIGKPTSKTTKDDKTKWYNILDFYLRTIKCDETNGMLIGPHSSNVFSEIILTKIDNILYQKGYQFTRHIDDYSCFVGSYEGAERFILDLSAELKAFDLSLNAKKTKITTLPQPSNNKWVRKLNNFYIGHKYTKDNKQIFELKRLSAYLDIVIDAAVQNNNSAVVNYAMKVIAKKHLGKDALSLYIDQINHLLLLYPYLVRLIDVCVFDAFKCIDDVKVSFMENIYDVGNKKCTYEACSYAILWALKYNITLNKNYVDDAIKSGDCVFMLMAFLLAKKSKNKAGLKLLKNEARRLMIDDCDRYWIFIYESLPQSDLTGEFKAIKTQKVSFVKNEYL